MSSTKITKREPNAHAAYFVESHLSQVLALKGGGQLTFKIKNGKVDSARTIWGRALAKRERNQDFIITANYRENTITIHSTYFSPIDQPEQIIGGVSLFPSQEEIEQANLSASPDSAALREQFFALTGPPLYLSRQETTKLIFETILTTFNCSESQAELFLTSASLNPDLRHDCTPELIEAHKERKTDPFSLFDVPSLYIEEPAAGADEPDEPATEQVKALLAEIDKD